MTIFDHEFVEFIPASLEPDISVEYATASHLCACGCGLRVVTPFSPADWKLTYDGETITLWPSIGNWSFDCQSHYFIRGGRVEWAPQWTRGRVEHGRTADRARKGRREGVHLEGEADDRPARSLVSRFRRGAKSLRRRLRRKH